MKKIIAVLLVALFLLCACGAEKNETGTRFVIEYSESSALVNSITVIRDTETGTAYLFVHSGYAGGLTRLVEDDNGAD